MPLLRPRMTGDNVGTLVCPQFDLVGLHRHLLLVLLTAARLLGSSCNIFCILSQLVSMEGVDRRILTTSPHSVGKSTIVTDTRI